MAFRFSAAAVVAALSALLWSVRASAAGPLGVNGDPITTSDYALDLFQGPLFAGSRVTGLAGAYVAIAEDVDGDLQNPAAPAVRPFFSYTNFDYWLGFGLTFALIFWVPCCGVALLPVGAAAATRLLAQIEGFAAPRGTVGSTTGGTVGPTLPA